MTTTPAKAKRTGSAFRMECAISTRIQAKPRQDLGAAHRRGRLSALELDGDEHRGADRRGADAEAAGPSRAGSGVQAHGPQRAGGRVHDLERWHGADVQRGPHLQPHAERRWLHGLLDDGGAVRTDASSHQGLAARLRARSRPTPKTSGARRKADVPSGTASPGSPRLPTFTLVRGPARRARRVEGRPVGGGDRREAMPRSQCSGPGPAV